MKYEPLLHIVLYQPEIPPNTGNIGRTCVAVGAKLWLVKPLGFQINEKQLRRAGLDYWPHVDVRRPTSFEELEMALPGSRIIPVSSKVTRTYAGERYRDGDCLLFGSESKGLPATVLERLAANAVTIPMPGGHVRSLNLATAVGIVLYEALRQLHNW